VFHKTTPELQDQDQNHTLQDQDHDHLLSQTGLVLRPTVSDHSTGPRSFAVAGPSTWNALPAPLRNDELSAVSFRRQLKTELYIRAYYSH